MTFSYTASYGVGKGQHHVSGAVTATNETKARAVILDELRRKFPHATATRTLRIQTLTLQKEPPMTGEGSQTPSTGDTIVARINDLTNVIGTLVPTVGAIGGIVRLVATVIRPSDAQAAQVFDAAIAGLDAAEARLNASIEGFEAAKAAAAAPAS